MVLSGSELCTVHLAFVVQGEISKHGSLHFSCKQDCLLGQSWSVVHSATLTGTEGKESFTKWEENSTFSFCSYFWYKLNHMDFPDIPLCIRRWLCDYVLYNLHWLSSPGKGLHISHFYMPMGQHTLDLRGIHIACIFRMGSLCILASKHMMLCGFLRCTQHWHHISQRCMGQCIPCCSKLP